MYDACGPKPKGHSQSDEEFNAECHAPNKCWDLECEDALPGGKEDLHSINLAMDSVNAEAANRGTWKLLTA